MLAGRRLVLLAYCREIVWWKGGGSGRDVFCHVQLEFFSPLLSSPVLKSWTLVRQYLCNFMAEN